MEKAQQNPSVQNAAQAVSAGVGRPFFMPAIQPKLSINQPGDIYEQEADAVADKVMCMSDTAQGDSFFKPSPINIQRKCQHCEEEEKKMHRKESGNDAPSATPHTESYVQSLSGKGSALSIAEKSFFEPRFGHDFSNVRLHTGTDAHISAKEVNAHAYTFGNNIVFGNNQYQPGSDAGNRLMAHELTHVIQRGSGISPKLIQRTVHGGSSPVPTNCHNWTIPLPPWIAGTLAHSQIAGFFGAMGALPHLIPRAIKLSPCTTSVGPRPFGTPPGFADLWVRKPTAVEIAEIKSTATGDACAAAEAQHYVNRHDDWLSRSGTFPLALDDSLYSGTVGLPVPGGLLNLSSITGTDLPLGPFVGDPLKMLHVEADATGAVVYWCTGMGMINPAWLLLLKALLDRLKQLMEQMRREWNRLQPILEQAAAMALTILKWMVIVLLAIALLALIVVIIVCAIAEIPTAGLATICEVPAIAAAAGVVAAIIELFGVTAPAFASSVMLFFNSRPAAAATSGERGSDYERDADSRSTPAVPSRPADASVGDRMAAAMQGIASSISVSGVADIASSLTAVPDRAGPVLDRAAASLDTMGDAGTAAFLRQGKTTLRIT